MRASCRKRQIPGPGRRRCGPGEIMKCFAPEQLPVLIATIVHDPTRRRLPLPVRIVLRLIGATDFMQLSTSRGQGVAS
jgi:hypothetical protein